MLAGTLTSPPRTGASLEPARPGDQGQNQGSCRQGEAGSSPTGLPLPWRGRAVVVVTDCQLVLLHRRQAEHVWVFSSIRFIKGFDVNGEFLHKGASEPACGREAFVRTSGLQGWLWDGRARACWTPPGRRGRKGWSGGQDLPVLSTSGNFPLSRELPRPGWGVWNVFRGKRETLQEAARSPMAIVHV